MKKPRWTKEEHAVLMEQVKVHGPPNWAAISEALPRRSPNSCRRRWCQYLSPAAVHANRPFTTQEDEKITTKYHEFPNKWAIIAGFLPSRTADAIKNRWYSVLRKVYLQQLPAAAAKRRLPDGALVLFPLAPGDVKAFGRDMMIPPPVLHHPPPGVDLSGESLNSSGEPVERKLFTPNKRRAKKLKEPIPEEFLRRSKRQATKAGGYKKESAVEILNPKPIAIIPPPAPAPYLNKDIIVRGIPTCLL